MITQQTEISKLIADSNYKKIKLYVDLGFELSLTDLNGDYSQKFGSYNNPLFDCVINNDIENLKKIKSKHLNHTTNSGYTALHWSIILHRNEIVRYLLENNVNIEIENSYSENAFILAARFNNHQAMKLLLNKTCDQAIIFKSNFRDFNSLLFAMCNKNTEMIEQLIPLANKSILWQRNIFGANCLHWLVHGNKLNDVQKLLLVQKFISSTKNNMKSSKKLINGLLTHVNAIGYSPLNWLEKYNNQESFLVLQDYA